MRITITQNHAQKGTQDKGHNANSNQNANEHANKNHEDSEQMSLRSKTAIAIVCVSSMTRIRGGIITLLIVRNMRSIRNTNENNTSICKNHDQNNIWNTRQNNDTVNNR